MPFALFYHSQNGGFNELLTERRFRYFTQASGKTSKLRSMAFFIQIYLTELAISALSDHITQRAINFCQSIIAQEFLSVLLMTANLPTERTHHVLSLRHVI
jgi:hypothetical protein